MKHVPPDLLLLWCPPSGEAEPLAGEGGACPPAEGPAAGGEEEECPGGETAAEAGEEQGTAKA